MEWDCLELLARTLRQENTVKLNNAAKRQSGMTIIELMISVAVLAVGMGALIILFSTAAMTNSRSKTDTTGTMLAQTVLDQIASMAANNNVPFTITDCTGNVFTIATAGAANPGNGAAIDNTTGNIDYTQAFGAVTVNYAMRYTVCGPAGQRPVYDVRWNIMTVTGNTRMITVAARQTSMGGNGATRALLFSQPITLRTIAGM
jgi:prepilin-type N-terminal cleavage/methylation domain-containing protein